MSEKRFTLTTTECDGTLSFYDDEYDCETRMSTEYVLDKVEITLNALHRDNQRLEETLQKKEELLRNVLKVNDNLTKKIRELEEPSCWKCIHFSCDSADNYCIEKRYDIIEDMSIAKDCKEYKSVL